MTRPAVWKMLLYTAVLFVAGAICGAMVMTRMTPVSQPLKLGRTGEITLKLRSRLIQGLGLTPDQQQKIEPFIETTSTNLEVIHKDCLDRISAALDSLHQQIKTNLTPEQIDLLNALEAARNQTMLQKYNYRPGGTNLGSN
jgi:hypothetical protein